MIAETEDILLAQCKHLIEAKLNWGDSEGWTNQDFEELSQKIFEATSVTLSPTTLKRIWGKVKYDSAPTITTLNTLAQFIGFEHWRAFRQSQISINDTTTKAEIKEETIREPSRKSPWLSFAIPLVIVLSIVSWYFISNASNTPLKVNPNDYTFSSKKVVSLGVPNSVVFDYDASRSPHDSVYIQQSWDRSKRVQVSKHQHQHASIYYYPGFFQAKLSIGNQVVKEHNLFIQTDGWLSVVEQTPVPVYFKKEETIQDGKLGLSLAQIQAQNIKLQPVTPYVRYSNMRDFGDIQTGDFIFETSLKNDYQDGSSVCQDTEIRLLCEGSAIIIRLSAKGCIANNDILFVDKYISGKDYDLSGFGVDFRDFVKFRCESVNGKVKLFVNNKMAYQFDNTSVSSKIVGIGYRFQGTGLVDSARLLKSNRKVVYEDTFDTAAL